MSATTIIVNDETPRRQYTATGGQTVFDFPFPFFENGDLEVYKTPAGQTADDANDILTITSDYTVSGADTQNGGKITLTSGAAAGDIITILRVVDIDRTADYQAAGDLLAETLNREQDTEIMISQQLREEADRSMRLQKSDIKVDMTLPAQADRVDGILQFDSNGEPTVVSASQFVAGLSGAIIGANYITNNATGDGTTVNFTLSSAPGSKGNLQIYIDGVYQNKNTFSLTGTTVTFTEAPPLNASVEFIIGYSIGSTSGDATGIDFTQQGTGAVSRTVANKLYEFVSVKDFGAVGDGVTDDTAAIQAALDYAAISEGLVTVPEGTYKTTSQLTMASGVGLSGEGRRNASIIKAYHTDAAILNLKGSGFCIVKDIYLTTDSTLYPKTGMALGRSSAASAGNHHIENVKIQGYFDVAVFYSIASEINVINSLYLWNLGGASSAKYAFYTSKADDLSVDSFVTSTNLVANVTGLNIVNSSSDANAACIYIEAAESSGSWNFYGAYLTPYRGSYVEINNATDSQILGPYSFIACSGERLSGGDPIYGFKLTSSVACNFKGLNIIGTRFDFLAGSSHYPFWTDANFTYTTPNVVMQPPEAFPYAVSIYYENKIKGGQFRVGREYEWVAPTLAGSWANQFGSPYAQAGYQKDDTGIVSLRGTLTGGTGTIFTLPANFRPEADMFFGVYANGSMGRIKITSAGVVSLSSGTAPIDLSGINFVAGA